MHIRSRFLLGLEREYFFVDPVARYSEPQGRGDDAFAEAVWSTDIEVALSEVWNESSQSLRVDEDLVARANDLVELAAALCDEARELVAMHNALLGRGT